jgi:flagellar biosynthesis chaperone FliJ
MATGPTAFEQILELKQRKEEQAQTEVRGARLAAEQAARAVEERRREAEAFSKELLVRQARLYDEIEGKVCERRDVDDVREKIALLRAHETSLYEKIKQAEAERAKAAEALEAARAAHLQTVKNVEKFVQLVTIERTEIAAEEQASEDKEMEEFIRLGEPADA